MKQTTQGWRTDYRDRTGNRIREEYQSQTQAKAEQAIGKRRKETDRTLTKLLRAQYNPARLRCAQQRAGKKRCRCTAVAFHNDNGKPTCHRHQTTNRQSNTELRERAEAEALKVGY